MSLSSLLLGALLLTASPAAAVARPAEGVAESAELSRLDARLASLAEEIARHKAARAEQGSAFVSTRLESLLSESQQLSEQIRALRSRGVGRATSSGEAGADPRELQERADALRDQADAVARRSEALAKRRDQARREESLDRQLGRLGREDALFDESDRRLTATRTDPAAPTPEPTTRTPATPGSAATRTPGNALGTNVPRIPPAGATESGPALTAPQGTANYDAHAAGQADSSPLGQGVQGRIDPGTGAASSPLPLPSLSRQGEWARSPNASPRTLRDDAELGAAELDAELQRLEQERVRLEREADALQGQARALRSAK